MAVTLSAKHIPSLPDYRSALNRWTNTTTTFGSPDVKPLRGDGHKAANEIKLTIRKDDDESIAIRYHNTDVITFHPDGRLVLEPWASNSTNVLVRAVLQHAGITSYYHDGRGMLVRVGDYAWCIDGYMVLRHKPVTKTEIPSGYEVDTAAKAVELFQWITFDRKRVNEALRTSGWDAYAAWTKMVDAMDPKRDEMRGDLRMSEQRRMLADQTRWPELRCWYQPRVYTEAGRGRDISLAQQRLNQLAQLRIAVLKDAPDAYTVTESQSIPFDKMEAWCAHKRKYAALMD